MSTKRTKSSFRTMSTNRKLESVFLFVTGRCNAKCKMCFYAEDMDKKEKDLTFEETRQSPKQPGSSTVCGYPAVNRHCVRSYLKL